MGIYCERFVLVHYYKVVIKCSPIFDFIHPILNLFHLLYVDVLNFDTTLNILLLEAFYYYLSKEFSVQFYKLLLFEY